MTTIEKAALEAAVSDAFRGGEIKRRELRLSPGEAEQLRRYAVLSPMPGPAGEKRWYEVCPKGELVK